MQDTSFYIDKTLYTGRPTDETGRLPKELRCYDLLDSLGISYQRLDHDVTPSIQACEQVDALLGTRICKNLLLTNTQHTAFYLLMMPGDKRFKTKDLSKQIGSARLSFSEPEYMERFLNITPGSLSILGLMNDREGQVKLLIDKEVLKEDTLGCHPCINTSSLRIQTKALLEIFLPAVHHDYRLVEL